MPKENEYEVPINGVTPEQLEVAMRESLHAVARQFPPHTGIIVFTFDFGADGGTAYVSNAERNDCIQALEEWIANMRKMS